MRLRVHTRVLICTSLASSFVIVASGQEVGFCSHQSNVGQACEWTGDCDVPDCSNRCQPNWLVGDMQVALESAAYATDWWQMCPDLARYIRGLIFSSDGEDLSLTGPPPGSSGGLPPDDGLATGPARRRILRDEDVVDMHPGHARSSRNLLQDVSYLSNVPKSGDTARGDTPFAFHTLPCPTAEEIDRLAPTMLNVGLQMQDVFDTDARGEALTTDQTSLEFILGEQENRIRVWMTMFLDPEALKAYFAANCTMAEMGGPSSADRIAQFDFGRYIGDWTHNHVGTNDTFNVCRDKFGGYEEYARRAQIKDARCGDPFDDPGSYICFRSIAPLWWPTTEECATELAILHRQDPAVVFEVTSILWEVEDACKVNASETECLSVLSTDFEYRIDEAKELLTGNADVGEPVGAPAPQRPAPAPTPTQPPPTAQPTPVQPQPSAPPTLAQLPHSSPQSTSPQASRDARSDGGSVPAVAIVVPVTVIIVLALMLAAACVLRRQRRKKPAAAKAVPRNAEKKPVQARSYAEKWYEEPPPAHQLSLQSNLSSISPRSAANILAWQHASVQGLTLTSGTSAATIGSEWLAENVHITHLPLQGGVMTHTAGNVTTMAPTMSWGHLNSETVQPLEKLVAQIEWLTFRGNGRLLDFLKLAPHLGRRIGGQGAIAFAQHYNSPNQQFAVKFFLHPPVFALEKAAACNEALRATMPPVALIEDTPEVLAKAVEGMPAPLNEWPLPPLIVTEKGESLDEFVARSAPDFLTSLQVMVHIAGKLSQLHNAGVAHRDLKPGNAIWLPSSNSWTLIDFGSSAPLGQSAELSFTVKYAPPETVKAYKAGEKVALVAASADVWALGVVCWELLSQETFYGKHASAESVISMLQGEQSLPSEKLLPADIDKRLGAGDFRQSIFNMLSRDPEARPTIPALLTVWGSLLPVALEIR